MMSDTFQQILSTGIDPFFLQRRFGSKEREVGGQDRDGICVAETPSKLAMQCTRNHRDGTSTCRRGKFVGWDVFGDCPRCDHSRNRGCGFRNVESSQSLLRSKRRSALLLVSSEIVYRSDNSFLPCSLLDNSSATRWKSSTTCRLRNICSVEKHLFKTLI